MPYWMKVCIFQNWELLSKMTLIRIWQKMTQILKEMQDDGTLRDMVEKYGLDAEKALGVTNAE